MEINRPVFLGWMVVVLVVALLWLPLTTTAGNSKGWSPLLVDKQLAMLIDAVTVLQMVNEDTECGIRAKQLQIILILRNPIPREIPMASYKLFTEACSFYPLKHPKE